MAKTPAQSTKIARSAKPPARRKKAEPKLRATVETLATSSAPGMPRGKLGAVVEMLRRPEGATVEALSAATGWQVHSVRGAMSGALKKKLGLAIISEKTDAGRVYRIQGEASA